MNWLETAPENRPDLPSRERIAGKIEVQCPICAHWRRGYLVEPLSTEDAARFGAGWGCDAERSTVVREEQIAPAEETQWISLAAFMGLFTDAQKGRATAPDAPERVRVLVLTTTTYPMINLLDPRVIGGIDALAEDGVLGDEPVVVAAEAARIKAGDLPVVDDVSQAAD